MWDLGVGAGGGIERAASPGGAALSASPLFLEINLRTYASEDPELLYGGSLRAEVTGAGAVGLVPRVELNPVPGPIQVRPGLGLGLYFTPRTLIGPELSVATRWSLTRELGLQFMGLVSIFVLGSDLPERSTLVQLGGYVGLSWMF